MWSDVVDRVSRLVRVFRPPCPSAPNSDLWCQIPDLLEQIGCRFEGMYKVTSHCDYQAEEDEVARWMYYNNKIADEAAGQANRERSSSFLGLVE